MKTKTSQFVCLSITVILVLWLSPKVSYSKPSTVKMINLHVVSKGQWQEAKTEIQRMLEDFLTSRDFLLVQNDSIPQLRVVIEKIIEGGNPDLNVEVRYRIHRFEIRLPNNTIDFSRSYAPKKSDGTKDKATRNAIGKLKRALAKDQRLINKLNNKDIFQRQFYDLNKSGHQELQDMISEIKRAIKKSHKNVNQRIKTLEKTFSVSFTNVIQTVENNGILLNEVIPILHQFQRDSNTPYQLSNECSEIKSKTYDSIAGVLINVPLQSGEKLNLSNTIYSENQCLVYDTPDYVSSFGILINKSKGKYFKHFSNYLTVNALKYNDYDHSIIISNCDADAILIANQKGMMPGQIFKDKLVVVIPK